MLKTTTIFVFCLILMIITTSAQNKTINTGAKQDEPKPLKKSNRRPVAETRRAEPFEKATAAEMATKCVKLETEAGAIEMEMFAESASETVRNFLNLISLGAFDTTTFSRVVPNFVIQGGNPSTREKITPDLAKRMQRAIPDEPNQIKHERGIVSMARTDTPNSASSHFFILVSPASSLDGTFAAFGRVTKGMETVDAINKMPVEGDKPSKSVRITRASILQCELPPAAQ